MISKISKSATKQNRIEIKKYITIIDVLATDILKYKYCVI